MCSVCAYDCNHDSAWQAQPFAVIWQLQCISTSVSCESFIMDYKQKELICIIYPHLTDTDTKPVALHSETASAVMYQYISKHHTPIINHHPIIDYHRYPNISASIYHASFLCLSSFINANLISTFV